MKKTFFTLGLFFSLFAAHAQENLLSNPGFEEGIPNVINGQKPTKGQWLAYFQAVRGGMEAEEAEGHEGTCLKLNVFSAEKPVWDNYIYQNVSLTPGEYEVSFWVKAENEADSRADLRFSIKPSISSYLGTRNAPWSPKKKVTTEWQQVVQNIKIAPEQEGLEDARFIIHLEKADNSYYIDDVVLKKIK